jgi:hypothetical protein
MIAALYLFCVQIFLCCLLDKTVFLSIGFTLDDENELVRMRDLV